MNSSTLLLLLLSFTTLYSTRSNQVSLLDTRLATELNWRTHSNQDERDGWLEETVYSEQDKVNHRVYSTCDLDHSNVENWLLFPELNPGEANRLYLEFGFTIVKCENVPRSKSCKETLKLYGISLRADEQLSHNWYNDSRWQFIDTIVASSETEKTQVQTTSFPVSPSSRVYFALKNTGACSAILYSNVYYNFCPEMYNLFMYLPRTIPAQDLHSVVTVSGQCVQNASPSLGNNNNNNDSQNRQGTMVAPPTSLCKADGTWQIVGASKCECNEGYIPSVKTSLCTACTIGSYKATRGFGECLLCPEHSTSFRAGSGLCECDAGYFRAKNDSIALPCKKKLPSERISEIEVDESHNNEYRLTDSGNSDWFNRFFTTRQFWPWIVVCFISVLVLCCVLFIISRYSASTHKEMSDLDVLDNYKQNTITPDYNRSLSGQVPVLPAVLKKTLNVPLISTYGTQRGTLGTTMLSNNRFKQYIDPTTYEDPNEALAEFTNEIKPESVTVTRVIGAGEFGEVCCGRLTIEDNYGQSQQHVVAVKTLLPGSTTKAKADFLTEASIMGQFDHENVIRLLGVVTKTEPVMILTEYMLNGSLDQFLKNNDNGKIETHQLVKMLHGIACGMKYLTDKGYVHRDLAARNVLVDDRLTCKIADFGLSRWLTDGSGEQEYTTKNGGKIPIRWTAPEAISFHKYTAASDVWSFGVVMWEVCSFGERPYWEWSNHKVIHEIQSGFRLPCPMGTPARLYEMMLECWQEERHQRPTFTQLASQLNAFLNDEFFFLPNRFIVYR